MQSWCHREAGRWCGWFPHPTFLPCGCAAPPLSADRIVMRSKLSRGTLSAFARQALVSTATMLYGQRTRRNARGGRHQVGATYHAVMVHLHSKKKNPCRGVRRKNTRPAGVPAPKKKETPPRGASSCVSVSPRGNRAKKQGPTLPRTPNHGGAPAICESKRPKGKRSSRPPTQYVTCLGDDSRTRVGQPPAHEASPRDGASAGRVRGVARARR